MAIGMEQLFSEEFYLWKYADVKAAVDAGGLKNAFEHYEQYGRAEGRQISGYFNEQWYLQKYPDVSQAVKAGAYSDGLDHFLKEGQFFEERRSSSDLVDQNWLYNYTQTKDPQAAAKIAKDELTGVEYFVGLPTGKEYEFTAERAYLGLWNDKNYDVIDQLTTGPEFIDRNVFQVLPGPYDNGQAGKLIGGPDVGGKPGTEGIKQTAKLFIDAVPDVVLQQKEFASEGNKLIIRWEENGTQTKQFGLGTYEVAPGVPLSQALNVPPLTKPTPIKIQGVIVTLFNPEGKMYERQGYPLGHETTTNFLEMGVPLGPISDRIQPVPTRQIQLVKDTYAAFQKGDQTAVLNNLTNDIVWNSQYSSNIPFAGQYTGPNGVVDYLGKVNNSVDILSFAPQEFTAQNNTVTVQGSEKIRVKSTGREYTNNWVHIWDLEGNKVDKITTYNDTAAVAAAF